MSTKQNLKHQPNVNIYAENEQGTKASADYTLDEFITLMNDLVHQDIEGLKTLNIALTFKPTVRRTIRDRMFI